MYDERKLGEEVLTFLNQEPADDLDRLAHRAVRILVDTADRSWDEDSHLPLARMLAHSTLFLISRQGKHYAFIPRHLENRNTVDLSGEIVGFNDAPEQNVGRLVSLAQSRLSQAERIVGRESSNTICTAGDEARRATHAWRAIMRETGDTDCVAPARSPYRQLQHHEPQASSSWFGGILGLANPGRGRLFPQLGLGTI